MQSQKTRGAGLLLVMVLAFGMAAAPGFARVQVGEVLRANVETPHLYAGSPDGSANLVWQHQLIQPGATYVALEFANFDLAPGDYLVVSDGNGNQSYHLRGRGKMEAGQFWSQHVKGDTVRLELYSTTSTGGPGFDIVNIAVGNVDLGSADNTRAICGSDDKQNAVCYQSSHPTEYDSSRAVARMLISGAFLCTGWLASPDSYLVTNEHCVTSATEALNTDFEFMAEAPTCGTGNCQLCHPGALFSGGTFIQDNPSLDYALIRITGNPAATYGHLQIDNRDAVNGERIYIPQHPGGRAKELGIFSSASSDSSDGLCHVNSVTSAACTGGGYFDVGYFCDTEGGSSGSPVIAASNHQVIALHHCANCPNRGVPIDLVYAEIAGFLTPQCTNDGDCDDGLFCTGIESCNGGACASGSDPCPGQDCDEPTQSCIPLVCDSDGTCESGEDCNNCGDDCVSGTTGATCGNDICETGLGENCSTCPGDCNSRQNGSPANRYCCGSDVGCGDSRCTGNGNTCSSAGATSYCCGDGTCEGDETSSNCALDCGAPPFCGDTICDSGSGEDSCSCALDCGAAPVSETSCSNGVDDDCDNDVDCADADCSGDPACDTTCSQLGDSCSVNSDCCSNKCRGPSGRKTCK